MKRWYVNYVRDFDDAMILLLIEFFFSSKYLSYGGTPVRRGSKIY